MTIAAAAALAVLVGLHRPRRLAHGVEHAGEVDPDRLVPPLGIVDVDLPVGVAVAFGATRSRCRHRARRWRSAMSQPAIGRDVAVERGRRPRASLETSHTAPAHLVAGVRPAAAPRARAPAPSMSVSVTLAPASAMRLGIGEADPARRAGDQRRAAARRRTGRAVLGSAIVLDQR